MVPAPNAVENAVTDLDALAVTPLSETSVELSANCTSRVRGFTKVDNSCDGNSDDDDRYKSHVVIDVPVRIKSHTDDMLGTKTVETCVKRC